MCGEKFRFNYGKVKDMAESKGSLIAKSVQKHAGRAKEKILQNLGKVDRTADDIFDEHLQNFTKQQTAANRLQKEFNNYIRCIRAVQTASRSLLEAIGDVYESNWSGHDLLFIQAQNVDMLWQDFSHKLGDQVLIPLNTYQAQFPEMRKKIDKRGRKLVDYDGQRHSFQALQASMTKKRDDVKITKGREQLEEAKRTYEMLNSELHDELPALNDSRVLFLVTNLQTLFSSEQVFHAETAKVYAELEAIVDKLATDSQRGSYSMKKTNGSTVSPTKAMNNSPLIINNIAPPANNNTTLTPEDTPTTPTKSISESDKRNSDPPPSSTPPPVPVTPPPTSAVPETTATIMPPQTTENNVDPPEQAEVAPKAPPVTDHPVVVNGNGVPKPPVADSPPATPPPTAGNATPQNGTLSNNAIPPSNNNSTTTTTTTTTPNSKHVEELYDIPIGATTDNLPPGVLYRVKATYKYNQEDVDELSFDVGETIRVIEYEDPEEQEEGWLMGLKEGSGEKGMFPANFTRPL